MAQQSRKPSHNRKPQPRTGSRKARDPIFDTISRNIRTVMGERDMTRAELADLLGLSASTVSESFNGRRAWSIHDLIVLSDYFDVSIDQLLGDSLIVRKTCFRQGEFSTAA